MKKALMAALLATALAVTPVIALGANSRPSYSDSGSDGGGSSDAPVNVVYGATASGAAASTSTAGQSQQQALGPGAGPAAAPAVPQNYQPAAMPTSEHKSTAAPAVQSSESAPATGDWFYDTATGGWNFSSGGAQAKSQWVNASNPYANANAGQAQNSWFYFDESGKMMTGWQWVDGKLYYFNEKADGTLGCSMANTTIDGKTLNAAGQWVVEGVVQTR